MFQRKPDYLLKGRGMSMRDAGIMDGDLLAVQKTREAKNGQIVVARLGDEVTVKRLRKTQRHIELIPENPDFSTIVVAPDDASFELDGFVVTQKAPSDFQLKQMLDILRGRLAARGIDMRCMDVAEPEVNLAGARQKVTIKQGIEQKKATQLVAALKEAKLKVEAQINGDKLRVSGKKRDDLQDAMALLRKTDIELPLQFDNFRD
jgi:uncharacterized protein YajQ (UPF0234 family)